ASTSRTSSCTTCPPTAAVRWWSRWQARPRRSGRYRCWTSSATARSHRRRSMAERSTLQVAPAGALTGELTVPGDKSISHRAVMVGSLCDERVTVTGFGASADTLATVEAFRALGVEIERDGDRLRIEG